VCAGGITQKIYNYLPKNLYQREFNKVSISLNEYANRIALEDENTLICTLSRHELGQFMLKEALNAGVVLEDSRKAVGVYPKVKIIRADEVGKADARDYGYENLVGADGSNSVVRKFFVRNRSPKMIFYHWKAEPTEELWIGLLPKLGFGGLCIFPHKNYSVAEAGGYLTDLKMVKEHALNVFTEEIGLGLRNQSQVFPICSEYRGYRFKDTYLIGDAGGFANSITGEGISYAIYSGIAVAKQILGDKSGKKIMNLILARKRKHKIFKRFLLNKFLLKEIKHISSSKLKNVASKWTNRQLDFWNRIKPLVKNET
jgi:flavin-dependent dehydrogenase